MKVNYNSSLWSKDKGPYGLVQKTNWEFEYAGTKRYIPAIYRFSKGIVFDILTPLDEAKLQEFFQKYEDIEEKLTPIERRCAEHEHPYEAVPIQEIWINGQRIKGSYSSSGNMSIPWAREDDNLGEVRKAYASILKDRTCFACARYCVPYPEADSKIQKILRFLRQDTVKSLKLSTHSTQKFYSLDISFDMQETDDQKVFVFQHPITEIVHTLYFQNAKTVEIPIPRGSGNNQYLYMNQAMYEMEPALPEGDTLQFNNSIQFTEATENNNLRSVGAIGIIGGADGPTSVFLSSKGEKNIPRGLHGLALHNCFSIPSFSKENTPIFLLEGIRIKKKDSMEFHFKY